MFAILALGALILQSATAEQGRRFLDERNFEAAEAIFRDLVAKNPMDSRAHYYLGLALSRQDRIEEAIPVLERARDVAGRENPAILFELGTALSRTERFNEAEQALSRAVSLVPNEPAMRLQLGWVYYSKLEGEKAKAEFEKVLEAEPSALAWLYLGQTEVALGENESAITSFRNAIRLAPDLRDAHLALGTTLSQSGKDAEAKEVLQKALALDPGAAEAHFQLGLIALRSGDGEQASLAFRAATEKDPEHLKAWYNRALMAERLGRREEADAAWRRVEELRASADSDLRRARARMP